MKYIATARKRRLMVTNGVVTVANSIIALGKDEYFLLHLLYCNI